MGMINHTVPVSMIAPLEVPIGVNVLIAVLEDVLHNIQNNRQSELESEDEQEEIDSMIVQRQEFLSWLRMQPGPNVAVALYPLSSTMISVPTGSGSVLYS